MGRKIVTIITAVTNDRVVIGEEEFLHAMEHFSMLPKDMLLELIERVLKDPTKIFEEQKLHPIDGAETRPFRAERKRRSSVFRADALKFEVDKSGSKCV